MQNVFAIMIAIGKENAYYGGQKMVIAKKQTIERDGAKIVVRFDQSDITGFIERVRINVFQPNGDNFGFDKTFKSIISETKTIDGIRYDIEFDKNNGQYTITTSDRRKRFLFDQYYPVKETIWDEEEKQRILNYKG